MKDYPLAFACQMLGKSMADTVFLDNETGFLFEPAGQIELVVKETSATLFDAPGEELRHVNGRCSFESIILKDV